MKTRFLLLSLLAIGGPAYGQTITFEAVPSGAATMDQQDISNEYAVAPFGVSFSVVDGNEAFVDNPKIAKVGAPTTAFSGCPGSDEPQPNQGVGQSFLTSFHATSRNLLVEYSGAVAEASGVLLDVDRRSNGRFEEWTITARRSDGSTVDQTVVVAPIGPDPSCTTFAGSGPGDGLAISWSVESPTGSLEITSIFLKNTGTATLSSVGIAFDNFSPSSIPEPVPALSAPGLSFLVAWLLIAAVLFSVRRRLARFG